MKTKLMLVVAVCLSVVACSNQSNEEKIKQQISERTYSLNADERSLVQANGKSYFEKNWIIADGAQGQLINCRPSDSNANGLVSCNGYIPQKNGTFKESKMYCGYRAELIGCSDEDTFK